MSKLIERKPIKKLQNLQKIPGVGESIAQDFLDIGIKRISCLKGKDPEKLYQKICDKQGTKVDRCMLYVCREAVYFAETPKNKRNPQKLKWWNWKD
jgi:hypothetical protein